jgi:hypothetical protein
VTLGRTRNTEDSSNQGAGKRSRYRATWITSILVALAATATAALNTFARADTPRTAADITPNPSPITLSSQVMTHDPSGSFRIQAYGQGNARTVLGTRAVKLIDPATRNPRGSATFRRSGTTLRLIGHSYDPDSIRARLHVRTYNNGHVIGATRSNGKTHRYEMRVRLRDGLNRVNVKAFNIGMGTRSAVIAGRAVYRLQPAWTRGSRDAPKVGAAWAHELAQGWC